MNYRDPSHPIWPIVKMAVVLLALVFTLWLNAEHFDSTEIKTIIAMFFPLLGVEILPKLFGKTS